MPLKVYGQTTRTTHQSYKLHEVGKEAMQILTNSTHLLLSQAFSFLPSLPALPEGTMDQAAEPS